ncbi:MAG TPA: type I-C CRISPR-associated endonuclease Cas1c [Thermoanaerobaculia bacterium]|jgi:CRISPR-associated protein Cas1|nr:type I-C CRISPR-associated endonuclease Cas1c [Thermoanaerobaculia bacterium]
MKRHQNTLYVTTQGAYLAKDGEAVAVRVAEETRLRIPIHTLGGIVCFGQVGASPFLLGFCGERGVAVSFLTENGRFLARVQGPVSGNVLLRREQYRRADDDSGAAGITRSLLAAKIANSRTVIQRALRDRPQSPGVETLRSAAMVLGQHLDSLREGIPLDGLRGIEGNAARLYFEVFDELITQQKEDFFFRERSRRPPLDNVNALLSFLYTLLCHDCAAALESVGLDPAVGFLHRDRPGRPSLALDLMEEFRAVLADRLALSLINLQQIRGDGFSRGETGGVMMDEATRKKVLVEYQKRKQEEIVHPFLGEKTTVGLLPHLQAALLARHLRADLDGYPPFLWK